MPGAGYQARRIVNKEWGSSAPVFYAARRSGVYFCFKMRKNRRDLAFALVSTPPPPPPTLAALHPKLEKPKTATQHQQASVLASVAASAATATEPDESLVQALHKMGISSNRARRACVATGNASREAALAWCVEHAADPAMDAPFVSSSRAAGVGKGGGGSGAGSDDGRQQQGEEMRAAARHRGVAAAALEAYVRARLSAIGESGGRDGVSGGGGGGVGDGRARVGVHSEEMGELVAVLTSFRKRQSLGQAEDKARAVLPATVDLGMFAEDERYRQVRSLSVPVRRSCCVDV